MRETRVGNPDKARFFEISDLNYGGVFIIDTQKVNLKSERKKIEKKIKDGCIPAGILLAYSKGYEVDNVSGKVITKELAEKISRHLKKCNICAYVWKKLKIPSS